MTKEQSQLHKALYRNYKTPEQLAAIKSEKDKSRNNKLKQNSLIDNSKGSGAWRRIGEIKDRLNLSASLDDPLFSYEPRA